jgi:hypothetical protein
MLLIKISGGTNLMLNLEIVGYGTNPSNHPALFFIRRIILNYPLDQNH